MKTIIRRVSLVSVLAFLGLSNVANAVSIRIDFTGVVWSANRFNSNGVATTDNAFLNQTVVGSMFAEIDGLDRVTTINTQYSSLEFNDLSTAPDLFSSLLSIGGTNYDIGQYGIDTGGIRFLDSKGPVSCGPGCSSTTPDQMSIYDSSFQAGIGPGYPFPPPGSYNGSGLTLSFSSGSDPLNPLVGQNYIDLTQNLDALSIVSIPLATDQFRAITGHYSENLLTCTTQSCRSTQSLAVAFDITSITRAVVNVPEPGAFALFLFALALFFVTRKRSMGL